MKEDIKQATEEGAYDRVAELAEQLKSLEATDGIQKKKEEIKQATEEGAYDRVAELAQQLKGLEATAGGEQQQQQQQPQRKQRKKGKKGKEEKGEPHKESAAAPPAKQAEAGDSDGAPPPVRAIRSETNCAVRAFAGTPHVPRLPSSSRSDLAFFASDST